MKNWEWRKWKLERRGWRTGRGMKNWERREWKLERRVWRTGRGMKNCMGEDRMEVD